MRQRLASRGKPTFREVLRDRGSCAPACLAAGARLISGDRMLRTLMPPVWLSRSSRFRWAYQLRTRRAFTAPAILISGAVGACVDSAPETLTRS
jgi:hypothetical protein